MISGLMWGLVARDHGTFQVCPSKFPYSSLVVRYQKIGVLNCDCLILIQMFFQRIIDKENLSLTSLYPLMMTR